MNENDILQLEEVLRNLPKEVKIFLYEGSFENAFTSISQTHALTEDQKKNLRVLLVKVLCFLSSKDSLIELFTSWGLAQEKQALLAKDIDEKIFTPIIEATNYIVEEEENEESDPSLTDTTKEEPVKDPYAELQKRFLYGTPIVQAQKKTYSLDKFPLPPRPQEKDGALIPPQSPTAPIDPYRERPE